jgi:hypothetical protein
MSSTRSLLTGLGGGATSDSSDLSQAVAELALALASGASNLQLAGSLAAATAQAAFASNLAASNLVVESNALQATSNALAAALAATSGAAVYASNTVAAVPAVYASNAAAFGSNLAVADSNALQATSNALAYSIAYTSNGLLLASNALSGSVAAASNAAAFGSNPAAVALPAAGGTITGSLAVTGSLTVSGTATTVNTSNVAIQDALVVLNTGLPSGAPPPATVVSGLEIVLGCNAPFYLAYTAADGLLHAGASNAAASSLGSNAVATRDPALPTGFPYFDAAQGRPWAWSSKTVLSKHCLQSSRRA